MNYTLTEDILRADGFSCRYIAFGKGKESMVLIPGLSMKSLKTSARSVAASNRVFTDRYRVYVFDSREDLPPGFTVEDMAGDLALCMKALGLSGADILGISQGGMIAQYLAVRHPELVRKLVLAVTLGKINEALSSLCDRWTDFIRDENYEGLSEDVLSSMYTEGFRERFGWLISGGSIRETMTDPDRFIIQTRACLSCDILDQLDRIRCPAFVIGSRLDRVVTGEASVLLSDRLGCPLYMYEDCGHAVYEEKARDFTRRVLSFFEE